MAWRRRCVALALLACWSTAVIAAPRRIDVVGFSLRFDDGQWERQTAALPALVTLRCIAAGCSPDNVLTFVRDERPLIGPGFAPFGPGAATGASVDLRLQSLTPGSRLLARAPVEPVLLDDAGGYRGLYDVEDRALAKTVALIVLLPLAQGSLEIRMAAKTLSKTDIAAFDALLTGFERQN